MKTNIDMKNPIYVSTGAFTGRKNGRNYKLAIEFSQSLECDGYEFLIFDDFYDNIDTIINDYNCAELNIPVTHTEKNIGDLLGNSTEDYEKSIELFKKNCDIATRLGSKKIVLHAWGYPASDENPELTIERLSRYISIAKEYSINLLVENIMCSYGDPLEFLQKIHSVYPELQYIIDTRHAQFHSELKKTLESNIMQNVRHIHINDYSGGYKDWGKRNPILQPTLGDIDWQMFFDKLKEMDYSHSITLDAPSMLENGVDFKTLNKSLDFIKKGLK